jgi:hypothetical protein
VRAAKGVLPVVLGEAAVLVLGERREEDRSDRLDVRLGQLRRRPGENRDAHAPPKASRRYWWTRCTAIAPSPAADVIRFTEPCRTSPTANTPGMRVSSR